MFDAFSPALLIPMFAVFIASFMQSVTGFGMAIIATPLLIISYEPKLVVIMLQFISICSNLIFGIYLYKKADLKLIGYLTLGAIIGQPLGLLVYSNVSNTTLKLFVSICILCFLILMKFFNAKIPETNRNSTITGFLSGILATTTGMSGPPLVMYLASTKQDPAALRATSIIYFAFINITALIGFSFTDQPMQVAAQNSIYLLPGLILGLILGNLAFKHVSAELFRQMIFAMLFFSCIYTIYTIV